MTTVSDNCHNLNTDLKAAVTLVRRGIWCDLIKVFLALTAVICIIKNAKYLNLTFNPTLTSDNLLILLTFILDLKVINDLRESSKKLFKLKKLRDEVKELYPDSAPNTCESQTCIMMKRVMEATFD